MKNLDQRNKIIEYSLKLNSTNLSPLRSGNISLRTNEDDKDGYLITPSGKKYETLKPDDIVFMGLNAEVENNLIQPINLHQNGGFIEIFILIKKMPKQLSMPTLHTQQLYLLTENLYLHFTI